MEQEETRLVSEDDIQGLIEEAKDLDELAPALTALVDMAMMPGYRVVSHHLNIDRYSWDRPGLCQYNVPVEYPIDVHPE